MTNPRQPIFLNLSNQSLNHQKKQSGSQIVYQNSTKLNRFRQKNSTWLIKKTLPDLRFFVVTIYPVVVISTVSTTLPFLRTLILSPSAKPTPVKLVNWVELVVAGIRVAYRANLFWGTVLVKGHGTKTGNPNFHVWDGKLLGSIYGIYVYIYIYIYGIIWDLYTYIYIYGMVNLNPTLFVAKRNTTMWHRRCRWIDLNN